MGSIAIAFVVFGWVFGGALLGIFFRKLLPNHHLSADSKDTVKLGMGLVGTMAALVLGPLVASAKGSYDAQSEELTQMSANIAILNRLLALYGPESKEAQHRFVPLRRGCSTSCGHVTAPAVASAPGAASVRVWQITTLGRRDSRWPGGIASPRPWAVRSARCRDDPSADAWPWRARPSPPRRTPRRSCWRARRPGS